MFIAAMYCSKCLLSLSQKIMRNINAAVSRFKENRSLFRGHVDMPPILGMTEEDRQQALQNTVAEDGSESQDCLLFVFELQ